MTIYFQTPDPFDIRGLTVFGAHAKPNSSAPIGHFGTGLKFAIATLARFGCKIVLTDSHNNFEASVVSTPGVFRGQELAELSLATATGPIPLPFTLELGKNWTPLMAYRELVSNTRDDKGKFGPRREKMPGFCIAITGDAIEQAFADHDKMFLDHPSVIEAFPTVEVCHKLSHGGVFYRGVRVAEFKNSRFTYNFLGAVRLTEDRTADTGGLEWNLGLTLGHAENEEIIEELCKSNDPELAQNPSFEQRLTLFGISQKLAERIMAKHEDGKAVNAATLQIAMKMLKREAKRTELSMSAAQKAMLDEALAVLRKNEIDILYPMKLCKSSEPNLSAVADMKAQEIILFEDAFERGLAYLVGTLYEEFLHLYRGFEDCTRTLQNFLFNRVAEIMIERSKK